MERYSVKSWFYTIKCYDCAANLVRNFGRINNAILYNYMYDQMEKLGL